MPSIEGDEAARIEEKRNVWFADKFFGSDGRWTYSWHQFSSKRKIEIPERFEDDSYIRCIVRTAERKSGPGGKRKKYNFSRAFFGNYGFALENPQRKIGQCKIGQAIKTSEHSEKYDPRCIPFSSSLSLCLYNYHEIKPRDVKIDWLFVFVLNLNMGPLILKPVKCQK